MFEKEAEEYCMHQSLLEDVRDNICMAFEDGAEFGYNKANEWHFVKDGDLPNTENLECLCIIRPDNEMLADFRGVLYFRSGRFYLDEDDCNSDFTDIVIAWREIVLPEEEVIE